MNMITDLNTRNLRPQTFQWLLEHGFNPSCPAYPARYMDTPLILASRKGREDVVTDLLTLAPEEIALNHRNMDGTNALWAAIVANSFSIADKLIAAGIDINNLNDNGANALMYASSAGKTEWVDYLLKQGADTQAETLDGFTALDLASNVACLRLLKTATRTQAASVA